VKLVALLTPGLMLALLWALQRLEVWMNRVPGSPGHARRRTVADHTASVGRRRGDGRP